MATGNPSTDIVFCHECENEWYRASHGLTCPTCGSDFTEIVEAGHDPRHRSESPEFVYENAPDPDEDDITDPQWHSNAPRTGAYQQQTPAAAPPIGQGQWYFPTRDGLQQNMPQDLSTMLNQIVGNIMGGVYTAGGPGSGSPPRPPREQGTSSGRPPREQGGDTQPGSPGFREWNNPTPGVRTFDRPGFHMEIRSTSGGSGWTTTYGSGNMNQGFNTSASGGASPFGAFGQLGPMLVNMFGDGFQRGGDYAWTQEGFDRIVSQLMEQHATGSAPGPATDAAISSLPTRKIAQDDLGNENKAECSICMEEVPLGGIVTELPCRHWFHGECIQAWLKEHDTCPHCRKGIMPEAGAAQDSSRPRNPGEAPRHEPMWGQGDGTRNAPYVVPESPNQTQPRRPNRLSRGSSSSVSTRRPSDSTRRPSDSGSLFTRMRNAFGGSSSGGGDG